MKIGVVTFHWAFNYGAVLQTYALQTVLENLGHQVEIIDYRPLWAKENQKFGIPRKPGEFIEFFDRMFRKRNFNQFIESYLNLSFKRYKKEDIVEGYDFVIVGSDQVFNPDIIYRDGILDTFYLLASVSNSIKKVSYAASFGNSYLDKEFNETFKNLLSSFLAISTREYSGKEILKTLGFKTWTVPDPTILLGDFSSLFKPKNLPNEKYVLNFIFQQSDLVGMVRQVIESKSDVPMKDIVGLRAKIANINRLYNLTPIQWINSIYNAKFVITDSFHATVFCILLHRPFISLTLDAWGGDWSERIKCLLTELGLQDRLVLNATIDSIQNIYFKNINWNDVDCRMLRMKDIGLAFLQEYIKK